MQEVQKQCSKCEELKPLSEFYSSQTGNRCKKCKKVYSRLYRQENADKLKEYRNRPEVKERKYKLQRETRQTDQYKKNNRDYQRNYYLLPKNKAKAFQRTNNYRNCPENKEKIRKQRQWHLSRPEMRERIRIRWNNRQARKRSLPDTLTSEQWQQALDWFHGCCATCGRQLNDMFGDYKVHIDHWLPLDYKGDDNPGTVAGNIVPLCQHCNCSKNATMPYKWLKWKFGKRKAKQIAARIQAYFDSLGKE